MPKMETANQKSESELYDMREETATLLISARDKQDYEAARERWNDLVVTCFNGNTFEAVLKVLDQRDEIDFAAGRYDLFENVGRWNQTRK